MGLSKKRKQHLAQISVRAAKSNKHRKTDQENQRRGKQREEEDFGMSTKIFDRNPVLTSRALLSLALMDAALMKKTWM